MGTIQVALGAVFVAAVGMGAAVGARALTAPDTVPYVALAPSGSQVPLGRTITRAPVAGHPGFSFEAPATGRLFADPAAVDQIVTLGLPNGTFIVRRWDGHPADPVAALREVTDTTGRIRRTTIAGMPAAFVDMKIGPRRIIREYRFAHDGTLYGAGVLGDADDAVVRDTGLAMLETWTWG